MAPHVVWRLDPEAGFWQQFHCTVPGGVAVSQQTGPGGGDGDGGDDGDGVGGDDGDGGDGDGDGGDGGGNVGDDDGDVGDDGMIY